MINLNHFSNETLPDRIIGMQKLEVLFKRKGYLICQSSGKRIEDFAKVVAVFMPLSHSTNQVMVVHCNHAKGFIQDLISELS